MLLYQRFQIPDDWDWSSGRPVLARDVSIGHDVHVYSGSTGSQSKRERVEQTVRIRDEVALARSCDLSTIETFTSGHSLWVVTPRNDEAAPFLDRLRLAGILPAPQVVIPDKGRRCSGCQGPLVGNETLCSSCQTSAIAKARLKKVALVAILIVPALLAAIWIGARVFEGSKKSVLLTAEFSSQQASIRGGEFDTLKWRTEGATSVAIDQGVGSVEPSGSTSVSPRTTTTYTLTAMGKTNVLTKTATVNVIEASSGQKVKPSPIQTPLEAGQPKHKDTVPEPEPKHPSASEPPYTSPERTEPQPGPQPLPERPLYIPVQPPPAPGSGVLHCSSPVPPNGQVIFDDLPNGRLHFDVDDRPNWQLLIQQQPDGKQRLTLVSRSSETQASCTVRWRLLP